MRSLLLDQEGAEPPTPDKSCRLKWESQDSDRSRKFHFYRRIQNHLPPIIAAQGLSKRFGAEPLFQNISFTLSESERIGLIGPNGSGKSTLLEILRGRVAPDAGEVAIRRGVRLASVAQNSEFPAGATVRS